jgi:hypothetical protein
MAEMELHVEKQIVPWADDSGYRFRLELIRTDEGASFRIHQAGDYVEIPYENWAEVRETLNRIGDFMSDEPQSEGERKPDDPCSADSLKQDFTS